MIVLDAECSHDRKAWPHGSAETGDGDLRLSLSRDRSKLVRLLFHLGREVGFEPLHEVIERVRPACYVEYGRRDGREVRQRADDVLGATPEDRGRYLRQGDRLALHQHQPAGRVIGRAVGNHLNAVIAAQDDEGAHAASSFFSSSFGG